jgi:hypothetical protein
LLSRSLCFCLLALDINPHHNSWVETTAIAAVTRLPERNEAEKIIASAGGVGAIWAKPIQSTLTSNPKSINFTLETSTLALIGLKVSQRGRVFLVCRRRRIQQADRALADGKHKSSRCTYLQQALIWQTPTAECDQHFAL